MTNLPILQWIYLSFRKIVDVEETQVLETTEIIEEQPTEVNVKN